MRTIFVELFGNRRAIYSPSWKSCRQARLSPATLSVEWNWEASPKKHNPTTTNEKKRLANPLILFYYDIINGQKSSLKESWEKRADLFATAPNTFLFMIDLSLFTWLILAFCMILIINNTRRWRNDVWRWWLLLLCASGQFKRLSFYLQMISTRASNCLRVHSETAWINGPIS